MSTKVLTVHDGRTDTTPDKVGMDAGRLAQLDTHFAGLIDSGKLQAASYLVARHGQIVAHRSMGKLTYKPDSPDLLPDSIRNTFSITKVITTVAIMQLVETGKLFLGQSVADWLEAFNHGSLRKISIWNLLTHTSGLAGDPGVHLEPYPKPWYEWWLSENKDGADSWTTDDWLRLMLSGPTRNAPGKEWLYNTRGFVILTEVIARASGMSYEEYVQKRILDPIGMRRSFFNVPDHLRQETCYISSWDEKDLYRPHKRAGLPPRGGNGMYSNLEDLWKFGQTILDGGTFRNSLSNSGNGSDQGRLLGNRTVELMVSNQLKNVPNRAWGSTEKDFKHAIGWSLNHDDICSPGTYSHEGAGRSGLYIDPVEKVVFVFFVPSTHDWVPESLINPRAIVWSSLL